MVIYNYRPFLTIIFLSLISISLVSFSIGKAQSQVPLEWQLASRIPDYLDDTHPPILVADQNKTIYAFADQWVGEDPQEKAIIIRTWTESGGWTPPIDILLSPSGNAFVYDAFLDDKGFLHLIFKGGEARQSSVFYSRAHVSNAGRAPSWSTPVAIGGGAITPGSASIIGNGTDQLTVIYSGNVQGEGVYFLQSEDSGLNWTQPQQIFLTFTSKAIPFGLQMVSNNPAEFHAVWNVVNNLGVDLTAYYARFDGETGEWTEPILLEERIEKQDYFGPSMPVITISDTTLVVMYNSGNPFVGGQVAPGRPVQRVRVSRDRGETWEIPTNPFPAHVGKSGRHDLVTDSAGNVHALFIQRIEQDTGGGYETIAGIWHSRFDGVSWTEPTVFELGEMSGFDLNAEVSQGNTLLVTYREDPGAGQLGVWYTATTLNSPELPRVQLPAPSIQIVASPTAESNRFIATPTPVVQVVNSEPPTENFSISGNPARPLFLGLLPVILTIIGVILIRIYFIRRA